MIDTQLLARLGSLWTRTVRRGDFSLEVIDIVERDDRLFATVRTILWSGDHIEDVREQEAFFGTAEDYDVDARNVAMVEAWLVVVGDVFAAMTVEAFNQLMPADFVFGDLAGLGNCETAPQFEKALRTKKRLGAYLPSTPKL